MISPKANWRAVRAVTIAADGGAPILLAGSARAADTSEADKLREELRSTVMQLRELQDQQAAAKSGPAPAAVTSAGPDTAALKAKLAAAQARLRAVQHDAADAAAARADADKAKADLAALQISAAATQAELDKFRAAFNQAADQGPVRHGRTGSVEGPARDRDHHSPSLSGQERTPHDLCRGPARPLRPYYSGREAPGARAGDRFHPRSSGKYSPGAGRHHPRNQMRPASRRSSRQSGGQMKAAG